MAILTRETQEKVVKLLVDEGLADPNLVKSAQEEVLKTKQPLIAYLTSKKIINTEMVAHATALVIGVQYVDLKNVYLYSNNECLMYSLAGVEKMYLAFDKHIEALKSYDGRHFVYGTNSDTEFITVK